MNIRISKIRSDDILILQKISIETFSDTFRKHNPQKAFNQYLKSAFEYSKLEEEIKDPNNMFYFIFYNDQLAGYTKLKEQTIQIDNCVAQALEVERLYIIKEFHHLGLGKHFLNHAYAKGKLLNLAYIYLSVWEKNNKAFIFYKSQGFVESGSRIFKLGPLQQNDVIMMKKIGDNL